MKPESCCIACCEGIARLESFFCSPVCEEVWVNNKPCAGRYHRYNSKEEESEWTPDQPLRPNFTNYNVWQREAFLADDAGTELVTIAFEAREAGMKLISNT